MSGLISISSSGGVKNNSPIISNLRAENVGNKNFLIKYIAEDFENTILRHYIYIDGKKTEITKMVGYEKPNNEFNVLINNVNPNTKYAIQIEVSDGIDVVKSDILFVTTLRALLYGVRVDESNSNPETSVTYIEDAIGVQVANSTSLNGWANKFPFNKIRIVGFKNGQVTKEINPNNKKNYLSGEVIPTDVDIMVEIPKIYWDFTGTTNGYELRISDSKFNSTCDCYAHKVGGVEKDYIYVGAYLGYVENGKLRSKSGVSPTVSQTLTNFRTYAHNVGSGYQQWNWFTLLLLQNLYLLAYKNLNSQQALGRGVSGVSSKVNTGGTNTKGMIFGSTNASQQVCFLGIEDFYGNIYQWVDGMKTDGSYNVLVTSDNKNFNDNASGFKNVGRSSYLGGGRTSKVLHTNEGGYVPTEINGSDTTYYCDYGYVYSGYFTRFGGHWNSGLAVGAFYLSVNYSASDSGSGLGSRLVFLG